jgi:DNA-binding beta-propeller fold protein YncE
MKTHKTFPAIVALLCAFVCAATVGAGSASAFTQFGEYGSGAGQLRWPFGVAFDQESDDVYVGDIENRRIDVFDAAGDFVTAWGWGVLDDK